MLDELKILVALEKAESQVVETLSNEQLSAAEMKQKLAQNIEEMTQVYFTEVAAEIPQDGKVHTLRPFGEQVIHTLLPPARMLGVQIPETPQLVIKNLADLTGKSGFVVVYRNDKWSTPSMIEWERYIEGVEVAD